MMASVAVLAISVFGAGAVAEQGANSPQQLTQQPKHANQQKQGNQKLNQAVQQEQKRTGLQQQQNLQQQKQAENVQQQQILQQQKQANQNQKLNQAVQDEQKRAELQQQQKLQQQKQAEKMQQQQQLQQQKQAELQQQQNQTSQARLLQQRVKEQNEKAALQQQNQAQNFQALQQRQAQLQHFDWNTYRPSQRPPLWSQYRQNFDPTPYQWAGYAPRQYVVRYVQPPGWQYQRWNYGQYYPQPYWQQQTYWLNNYSQYGLQPLPYGYVWVQNGPDALAVDSFSGMILQVIYGLFSGGGGSGLLGGLL
jgi:hypothetical protein